MILGFISGLFEGLDTLWDGLWRLPTVAFDPSSYASFWEYLTDREGVGEVLSVTFEHAKLVLTAMGFGVVIGLTLGIMIHRVTALRSPVLGILGVFLTLPSLALFAVFVPVVGIGDTGPIIALTMYALLPITRNTVTGLQEVDRAVVESAKGMGLSAVQRLVKVELPLAWPVILTGIRVSTLLATGIAAIAVLVGGTGLGVYIQDGLTRYPLPNSVEAVWIAVVFTVGLALLFDTCFTVLRKLTTSKGLQS
ncbi:MAG: ABC transporter permease [Acidimicrobiales bacterium]|nr:ABC transporter permease [Acidimicrobiales bacterium]